MNIPIDPENVYIPAPTVVRVETAGCGHHNNDYADHWTPGIKNDKVKSKNDLWVFMLGGNSGGKMEGYSSKLDTITRFDFWMSIVAARHIARYLSVYGNHKILKELSFRIYGIVSVTPGVDEHDSACVSCSCSEVAGIVKLLFCSTNLYGSRKRPKSMDDDCEAVVLKLMETIEDFYECKPGEISNIAFDCPEEDIMDSLQMSPFCN